MASWTLFLQLSNSNMLRYLILPNILLYEAIRLSSEIGNSYACSYEHVTTRKCNLYITCKCTWVLILSQFLDRLTRT